jgi:hypothetical protein
MDRKLQITLYVTAAYLAVFGILFVFAPRVFEKITQTTLPDAKLTLLYGVHTLVLPLWRLWQPERRKRPASCRSRFW